MADPRPLDQPARDDALDPTRSFITQAPAGSGKTGLLTQRYLRLLARVQAPEEIIAITFTRKAAGEMQARILEALEQAATQPAPDAPHARRSWECAREALARDRELGWSLLANPARLRVQTIDSLCAALARQMPLLSRFGAVPQTVEDARPLCIEAARRTIAELEGGADWSAAIAHLVRHLDNRLEYLQSLIATMLERREQWLRHVADRDHPSIARDNLEATLARVVEEALAELRERLPRDWQESLLPLARYAAANLPEENPVAACAGLRWWPAASIDARAQWEGLAELLLTKEGEWRKKVDKRHGFPAPGDGVDAGQKSLFKDMKARMGEFLVAARPQEEARAALAELRQLPPHRYRDEEWATLQALFDLLPLSVAQLYLVFQERGQVDFTAMARAAIEALGTDEAPTDLALALDYRIRHLLVDEFQDTSLTQYALLERLTAGWQPGDGRTLFLVGDPMQSIYRFREAEVGLFLKARHQGIGQVPLEFLRLSVNFRSQAGVVDWVNQAFPQILPSEDRVAEGAVSYAASTAFHGALEGVAVSVHPGLGRDALAEAEEVLATIQAARSEQPQGKVAVLVRGRGHLVEIVAALRARGLAFRAVEIERLGHRPVIQDLLALTRALEHPADRIAWLAVLRAPWCGLALADLHALAGADTASPVPCLLAGHGDLTGLGDDGRARLQRVWPVLETALTQRQRTSLRAAVEGVWLSLGGPACLTDATDLEDAEVFLRLLEELEEHGHGPDPALLEQRVARLFALPDVNAGEDIQLMTIHKSKGLEFDTVILPGLGRQTRGDEATLLDCLERPREPEASDLLLAPIKAVGEDQNPIGTYLKRLSRQKGEYEDGRLLYVAATRARRRLHLLGHVELKERPEGPVLGAPRAGSLLQRLWPVVEEAFQAALAGRDGASAAGTLDAPATAATGIRRLPLDWQRPAPPPPPALVLEARIPEVEELVEFTWAGETARHVGTVVHRFLQHFAAAPPAAGAIPAGYRDLARQWLRGLGVPGDHLQAAVDKTLEALETVLADMRGRWILDPGHQEARNEYALSGVLGGRLLHVILDRTFVDADGTRWIIDYKTGSHTGGGREAFLDREQERYRAQLQRYAALFARLDARPIRLGLYFPLMAAWREWGFMEEVSDS